MKHPISSATTILLALLTSLAGCEKPAAGPAETPEEASTAERLRAHVERLCVEERNTAHPDAYTAAADYIEATWRAQGYAEVERWTYDAGDGYEPAVLAVERRGLEDAWIVVGAHYDSVSGTVGADDNASGVAALLELSRRFREAPQTRLGVRFVAFPNEEPPHFETPTMGSRVEATRLVESGRDVQAMLSLESIGYYSSQPGSQGYPPLISALYPDTGDFVGVVGDTASRALVTRVSSLLEEQAAVPVESIAAPGGMTGIHWSDHASYWRIGVPAVMITDTATFRNPHYHEATDTPETLDYETFASLTDALLPVILELAGGS